MYLLMLWVQVAHIFLRLGMLLSHSRGKLPASLFCDKSIVTKLCMLLQMFGSCPSSLFSASSLHSVQKTFV